MVKIRVSSTSGPFLFYTEDNQLPTDVENDILHGVRKIAGYMRQLGFDMTERRCFDWVAAGRIPHTKVGVQIVSSKSAICDRFLASIK